jgi:threonine dehydrogenase-like Zn-dependent dehydrogenase
MRIERLANLVMTKRLDPSKLITHSFEGFENLDKAFDLMYKKPKDLIKPVVLIK